MATWQELRQLPASQLFQFPQLFRLGQGLSRCTAQLRVLVFHQRQVPGALRFCLGVGSCYTKQEVIQNKSPNKRNIYRPAGKKTNNILSYMHESTLQQALTPAIQPDPT